MLHFFRHKKCYWSKGLLFILLAICLPSCSEREERTPYGPETYGLTLAVSRTPLSAPFFIAQENGYFTEEGLDVKFLDLVGGHHCIEAILNGEAEMGTVSEVPIMFKGLERNDFRVLATFVTTYNDVKIMAHKDSGIRTANDLHGKRIAIVPGASSQFFLDLFLLVNNIDSESVTRVGMSADKMPLALHEKRIDAISAWEPFGFESRKMLGDQLLILPHDKVYRETFNLVVQRDFATKQPAVQVKAMRALQKAIAFMHNNEVSAQRMVAERLGEDREFMQWIWQDFDFGLRLDQELLITLEDEAKWALRSGLSERSNVPNYMNLIDIKALQEVSPGAVSMIH